MSESRPNIRVEIHNNLAEDMDVDQLNEEGEISDDAEHHPDDDVATKPEMWPGRPDNNKTFAIYERDKLEERARRFKLQPEEISSFSNAQQVYTTLGITAENADGVRFDAVHLVGVRGLPADGILAMFPGHEPTTIEWISADCCNVTFADRIGAARAVHFTSRVVKGMPVRGAQLGSFDDDEDDMAGLGIGRQVVLQEDEDILSKIDFANAADLEDVTIPIPPGYWRLANNKTKCVLVRFAFVADKQPSEVEDLRRHYKRLGEKKKKTNNGNSKGGIFDRNRDLLKEKDKNPWGVLAQDWDHDLRFREREPVVHEDDDDDDGQPAPIRLKNASLSMRLGKKEQEIKVEEEAEVEKKNNKKPVPESSRSSDESSEEEEEEEETLAERISKAPRMRMYADEEEQKVRRKKLIQVLKQQNEKIEESSKDLRNILGIAPRHEAKPKEEPRADLGLKLKNRSKNMVFTVARADEDDDEEEEMERDRDVRSFLDRRKTNQRSRGHNPIRRRSRSPINRRYRREEQQEEEEEEEEEEAVRSSNGYPRSKVAVVIKKQQRPTVASQVRAQISRSQESDSNESGQFSSESDEEEDEDKPPASRYRGGMRSMERPGFNRSVKSRLSRIDPKRSMKIEISNRLN